MIRYSLFLSLFFASAAALLAQGGSTPYPRPTPDPVFPDERTSDAVRRAEDLNRRSEALRMTQNLPPAVPDDKRAEFFAMIDPFYRATTEEERAMMAPASDDLEAYSETIKGKDSGIFRLLRDKGCASNPKVVSASEDCARLTMPGAGSGYSFRMADYRILHLADLVFNKGMFEALGVLNHGIMTDLGDIPIESVSGKTEGVGYIAKLKPSKNFAEAGDLAKRLTSGIKEGGRTYASILPVRLNSTSVLRSIAYDGESLKKAGPFVFNELELDKRRDILVAFRVVRLLNGDDATIIYRIVEDDKPPKLKADKK